MKTERGFVLVTSDGSYLTIIEESDCHPRYSTETDINEATVFYDRESINDVSRRWGEVLIIKKVLVTYGVKLDQ